MAFFDWKNTFNSIFFSLKLAGLWPKGNHHKCDLYGVYAITSITIFAFTHTFTQIVNTFLSEMTLETLSNTLIFIGPQVMTVMKTLSFFKDLRIIKELESELNSEIFQPKTKKQMDEANEALSFWGKITSCYRLAAIGTVIFLTSLPLLDKSYKQFQLPFAAWFPFGVKRKFVYQILYVYQTISLSFIGIANVHMDCLIVVLMIYIGAQCDILRDNLQHLKGFGFDFGTELIRSVKHHKKLVRFSQDFNYFVDNIILGQFFTSVSSFALILFQLSLVAPLNGQFFTLLSFTLSVTMQIFMYCWYGNEVKSKSSKLLYATFESNWPSETLRVHKDLLTFIIRLQKHIEITAINLFPLSLDTFMKIMRSSWSYFAVLNHINSSHI